jgi:hypothetical protein
MHSLAAIAFAFFVTPLFYAFDRLITLDATSAAGTYAGFAPYESACATMLPESLPLASTLSMKNAPAFAYAYAYRYHLICACGIQHPSCTTYVHPLPVSFI